MSMVANWLLVLALVQPLPVLNLNLNQEPVTVTVPRVGLLTLQVDGHTVAELDRSSFALPGVALYNEDSFSSWMEKLNSAVATPPVNAKLNSHGSVVPEQPGRMLDRDRLTAIFSAYFYGNGPARLELPFMPVYPAVDSALLTRIKEKAIGYYVTYYNSRNKNRAHNIALAAKAVDQQVVLPGQSFSFNRIVGQRTVDKGYKRAGVIVQGELAEGIGGGICQVSSTLYNAVDRAGLQIIQRYSHSRRVAYVPPGRDATVSWDGPDFVFVNRYDEAILIRASAANGRMQVSLYSSALLQTEPRQVPGISEAVPPEEHAS